MKLSGWCSPCKPGDGDHETCQGRLDNPKIDLVCDCPGHAKATADTPPPASKRGYW